MPVEHPIATPTTLTEASRAEMLSTLAAGTLHDVSHLLVLVLGCAELVLDDPALGERSRHLVEDVIRAGERAEVLAQQMLAFARGDVDAPAGMIDVVAALRAAEPLVRRAAGPTVTVTVEASGTPLWVRAAAADLDRVIVNLVANSRDAMPDGGRLWLRAAAAPAGAHDRTAAPQVRLTVRDTGHGIAHELRARLFEPSATTRWDDGHHGLGLAVVRAVVARLGGTVRTSSAPDGGPTVVVDLPAVATPPAP